MVEREHCSGAVTFFGAILPPIAPSRMVALVFAGSLQHLTSVSKCAGEIYHHQYVHSTALPASVAWRIVASVLLLE